jgi:subtilisin family serine protease
MGKAHCFGSKFSTHICDVMENACVQIRNEHKKSVFSRAVIALLTIIGAGSRLDLWTCRIPYISTERIEYDLLQNGDEQNCGVTLQNGGAKDGFDMNVAPAWQKGYTGKGVVVSILDDGIQTNHPDLALNYVSTPDVQILIILSTQA